MIDWSGDYEMVDGMLYVHGTEGDNRHVRVVPLQAIGTRMVLLGYTDPMDALAAIWAEHETDTDDVYGPVMAALSAATTRTDIPAAQARLRKRLNAPEPTPVTVNAMPREFARRAGAKPSLTEHVRSGVRDAIDKHAADYRKVLDEPKRAKSGEERRRKAVQEQQRKDVQKQIRTIARRGTVSKTAAARTVKETRATRRRQGGPGSTA